MTLLIGLLQLRDARMACETTCSTFNPPSHTNLMCLSALFLGSTAFAQYFRIRYCLYGMLSSLKGLFARTLTTRTMSTASNAFQRQHVPSQPGPSDFHLPLCEGLDLFEVTIDELQHFMSSGQLTAETYVQFCIERIRQVFAYLATALSTTWF